MDWWIDNGFAEFDDKDNRPNIALVDEHSFYMDGADREVYRSNYCPSCGFKYVNSKFRKRFDE